MQLLGPNDPKQIGGYQLLCLLGQGGMGQVYLGHSPAGKAVAVKIIRPEHASDQDFLARFRREVEAAKRVSGGYTAAVLEAGPNARPPWLVTEFVPGPSLAEAVVKVGRLPLDAVWRLAAGLIEALKAVHDGGLVHRDLKPANVLLAANGPKVIDFGISKSMSNAAFARSWTTLPNVTVAGGGPGTPGFMAPEQQFGELGPASDVYALGKVLAYAATGSIDVVNGIGATPVGADAARRPEFASIHGELRGLVVSCLAFFPGDRPSLDQLMDTVLAGAKRYPRASPLNFWREPLAGVIRDKLEELRRQLGGDLGIGPRPADDRSGVPSHPPTRPAYGAPQPGFESTRPAYGPRGTRLLVDDARNFQPTQGIQADGSLGVRAGAPGPSRRGQGSPMARGLSGSLFAVYRPHVRAGRRAGGPKNAVSYALAGDALFADGRFSEARDSYRGSIELDPGDPVVHVDLGRAYCELQQLMSAEAAFLEAIELDPLLIAAHRNRYVAVDMMTGRLPELAGVREEAQAACEEVLGIEARDLAGLANLGDACCCLSRYGEALRAYEQALSMEADNPRLIAKREYARKQGR
jgi:serine/threonine protein kinase